METDAADRELVAAFLETRDEAAFRRIYAAHAPRLYLALVRLSGGREAEADEALQETWIRAVGGLAGFRWDSRLATWLHGIAVNAWREIFRRRGKHAPLEAVPDPPADPAGGGGDVRLDLDREIRRLPDGYREVLLLHDVHGYTHEEIAGLLEIAPGTSKSQLARARQALRRRLAPAAGGPGKEMTR
jgi:RNA polymerase sigma-70 factor (ECF subfamily)